MDKLSQLKRYTQVVADTGDLKEVSRHQPMDATTNPSLILKAAQDPLYQGLVQQSLDKYRQLPQTQQQADRLLSLLHVQFGVALQQQVPGYVSTEVDPRLSFDTRASIIQARQIVDGYRLLGGDPQRVLIKLAATWQGVEAARVLELEGIRCNMTLIFNLTQAVACAQANATLVSPFVGRILDWYQQKTGQQYSLDTDPGVASVQQIYRYFKQHEHSTIVMGASFRNLEQIEGLAGCDRLTISPNLLQQLSQSHGLLSPVLTSDWLNQQYLPAMQVNANQFYWDLNNDAMATDKLAEGIRRFTEDSQTLEQHLLSWL